MISYADFTQLVYASIYRKTEAMTTAHEAALAAIARNLTILTSLNLSTTTYQTEAMAAAHEAALAAIVRMRPGALSTDVTEAVERVALRQRCVCVCVC